MVDRETFCQRFEFYWIFHLYYYISIYPSEYQFHSISRSASQKCTNWHLWITKLGSVPLECPLNFKPWSTLSSILETYNRSRCRSTFHFQLVSRNFQLWVHYQEYYPWVYSCPMTLAPVQEFSVTSSFFQLMYCSISLSSTTGYSCCPTYCTSCLFHLS